MGSVAARHAFATLALSAKLHKLLDHVAKGQHRKHEQAIDAFDTEIESALSHLDHAPLSEEARLEEMHALVRDFDFLERLYDELRIEKNFPETVTERFNRVFADIRDKIKEKGLQA